MIRYNRSFISILWFSTIYLNAQVQVGGNDKYYHEFGVNISSIIDRVLIIDQDSSLGLNTHYLTYKLHLNKFAIRSGFGLKLNKFQDKNKEFIDIITYDSRSFTGRLGLERRLVLSNRWVSYFGIDGLFGYSGSKHIIDSGFDRVITSRIKNDFGAGLSFGFQYNILKRLSLVIEMSLIYSIYYSKEQTTFDVFTDFNGPVSEQSGTIVNYYGPKNIYLSYKF